MNSPDFTNVAIVIPVYNHGRTVGPVVRKALETGRPVFLVDDGSSVDPAADLEDLGGVRILRHAANLGKGAALRTGMRAAVEADWAVTLDADGQHHPGDMAALLAAVPPGSRPIVVGCRRGMGNAPWTSRFGKVFSNFWVRLAGGPDVADTQSGFRLYPLPETRDLDVRAGRYQYEIEVLVKAAWEGIPVLEAPVQAAYGADLPRVSHFHPLRDFLRNTVVFTRLIFCRVIRWSKRGSGRQASAGARPRKS